MCKILITGFFVLFFSGQVMADFHTDFRDAVKLYKEKKYTEAAEAFQALAKKAPEQNSKAVSLEYAAKSFRDNKKYARALEVAGEIEIKPIGINAEMGILVAQRKFQELIDKFLDEDISLWTEDYIPKGFANRGYAYLVLKRYKEAAEDYERAVEYACDRMEMINALNHMASSLQQLGETDKALDTYLKAIEESHNRGGYVFYSSVIRAVNILNQQNKPDEALKVLKNLDLERLKGGYWLVIGLMAYGDIYLAKGEKEKALEKYTEATKVKHADEASIKKAEEKVEKLKANK